MGKTIRFNENSLIALKKELNEIMAGSNDIVSHNDVTVKLYHGTDILALVNILKTNRVCAGEGRQHGETHGINWFSLENDGSFNRGACFSIEVPKADLDTVFHKMNNVHVTSRNSCLDISGYSPKVEYFCGHTREGLNNCYRILTEKGERYPIEWMRDEIFYNWCERSGNEDTYMSVGDQDFGIIMANVLGEDAVRREGFINEAAPEVDKFSIGAESSDPPVGGNYYHEGTVEESYGNRIANIDMSEVGEVKCDEWTYDEEEYQEWLADNEIPDTPENKMAYIEDFNVEFEITYIDNQTYHTMGGDWAYYDDLEEVFGEKIAKRIETDMLQYGQSKFDTTELYSDSSYDINNPQELNDIAMKLLPHGEYFKDCRGFVLSNGVVLYTEGEHNDVQRIPGIHDKFQFVELGNIRVLERSIDIGAEPTWEQERVLRQIVSSYEGEKFYVDIFHDGGEISAFYPSADYRYVLGEIDRFYSEGIKPQGGFAYESKKSMKTINEISKASNKEIYSEAFKSWFGDWENVDADDFWYNEDVSKVVDENRMPGIVKHGTPNKFDTFDSNMIGTSTDPGWLGTGFYFYGDNDIYAGQYAGRNGVVMECYLNIRNPYIATGEDMDKLSEANSKEASDEFREYLESEGYDGVYYNEDLNEEWVAFYPEQIKRVGSFGVNENLEPEVSSSEVDLSSFKKRDTLPPKIWKDEETLNSRVRLKLLDIADDFWEFVNLTWVEPKGIIITGSICNFNWSKFSDIDLHLIVDFNEIDSKTEFVRQYLDSKKNEWNNEHEGLKIMGFPVELYVQNIGENPEAGGIYDLEENVWIRKPNPHSIKNIGLNKFNIKDKAAEIMTIINDMCETLSSTNDEYEVSKIGEDAHYLWDKVKDLRKKSLTKRGENGAGNIVYKVLRRTGYLDKLFKLFSASYDKSNSITESKEPLNEFLDNNYGIPLYKYFQWAEKASDRDKVEDLFYHCPWIIGKYLDNVSGYDEELSELEDELLGDRDLEYDEEYIERVLDALERNNLFTKLLDYPYAYAEAEELPAWFIMSFIRLVKNEWCIHFTSDADNIARVGFTGGTPEIEDLAYTNAGKQKHYAGYDFAFLINDRNVDFNGYGDEAVIFRASGVLLLHYGDEQRQVVFWGPSVKELIPIKKEEYSYDWKIEGLNGQVFATGKPSELADWATDNLPQYRNQIVAGKSGYRPWGFSRPKFDNEFIKHPVNNESIKKYLTLIKEEFAMDGSSEGNPYEKRWKAEREALKNFVANYGKLMQSKEDNKQGRLYKVYYDETMSNLIGYNYCICVQWDELTMKPKSTVYIRALDKFTPFIRRNLQFDNRGMDNQRGTYDDIRP